MQLSPEDMAAAEACGVSFLPATPAQVQRLAMQRKVFYAAGQPILATRGDGFYETAGTLQRVIEEARQQQRDLAAWERREGEAEAKARPPAADPDPELVAKPVVADVEETTEEAPRKRTRRSRPALAKADAGPLEQEVTLAEPQAAGVPPVPDDTIAKAAGSAGSRQQPGQRWVMAGAARRGRAGKHWSQRQR